jgi:ubiquinone/menaquinone biosynthesis C-methylase UbiE
MADKTKQEVREFYDEIGWRKEDSGLYQNARYEDMRPVSREYIHNTRLRVNDHLLPTGDLLLDAGSGPVQYDEYLTYSQGYQKRLCADISIQALREARTRIGNHGLFVVCDVAKLPFKADAFDGIISMHTIHHLPTDEHKTAYSELYRVLKPSRKAVIVNGWSHSFFDSLARFFNIVRRLLRGKPINVKHEEQVGTYVRKTSAKWLRRELGGLVKVDIFAWRFASTRTLRTFIHEKLGGRRILNWLYRMESKYPKFFGEHGQYPIIVVKK